MQLLKRLDNMDVLCMDIEKMATFYHEVLGLPFLYPHEPDEDWFAIQAGDVTLYFFRGKDEHLPPMAPDWREDPSGVACYSFAVEDLDVVIAEMDSKVEWASDVDRWEHPDGTWYRFRFFRDPEGNMMSFTEPHKA